MNIAGLQKFSAIDYPNKLACVVFSQGCNFNCPFCHNFELIKFKTKPKIQTHQIWDFLQTRKNKLQGVVVTGGEPTVQKDLVDFLGKIKELGFAIKLDTNGSNPQVLQRIFDLNLVDYIAMDIKHNLRLYEVASGVKTNLSNLHKSIQLIRKSGLEYEFRTTVVPGIHTSQNVLEIAKNLLPSEHYYLQEFRTIGVRSQPIFDSKKTIDLEGLQKQILKFLPHTKIRN